MALATARRWGQLAALLVASACQDPSFICVIDSDCSEDGVAGRCERGYCAYPAPVERCASGFAYSTSVPNRGGACVEPGLCLAGDCTDLSATPSDLSPDLSPEDAGAFALLPANAAIKRGESLRFQITGGRPPYSVTASSPNGAAGSGCDGALAGDTCTLTAELIGTLTLTATDADNQMSSGSITIAEASFVHTLEAGGLTIACAVAVDSSGIYVAGSEDESGVSRWRIEKLHPLTGSLLWSKKGALTPSGDNCSAALIAGGALFVAGNDGSPGTGGQMKIEKRDLLTGNLVPGFGAQGVLVNNPTATLDQVTALSSDGTSLYVGGRDTVSPDVFNPTSSRGRLEKRNLTTGALVAAFGTGGTLIVDTAPTVEQVVSLAIDGTGLYALGSENTGTGNSRYYTQKRDLTSGAVLWNQITDLCCLDVPSAVAVDATGVYSVGASRNSLGAVNDTTGRVEKRDLATGALLVGFGSAGVVLIDLTPTGPDNLRAVLPSPGQLFVLGDTSLTPTWMGARLSPTTGIATWGPKLFNDPGSSASFSSLGTALGAVETTGLIFAGTQPGSIGTALRVERRQRSSGDF